MSRRDLERRNESIERPPGRLDAFIGDSGSGGEQGLVPAPAAGDATKFLKGDGTWATVSGSGTGDVVGPAGATAGNFAVFADTTGKEIADGGTPGDGATADFGSTGGTICEGNDARLSDARTPTAHASSHVTSGSDKIRDATASQDGLMTAAYAAKLDGIAAGANAGITQLTGDVTAGPGSGSQAATIASDAVTNAKLANMAAWTVKVRNNAASGDPQDVVATDLTEETTPAAGDFLIGWESGGALRKFDVGDLPGGGSGSDIIWDYLGEFTASAAAQINADNIFDGTIYDEYEIELIAAPVTNNVSLVMYLRNSTPANAVTVRRGGGMFTRTDSASGGNTSYVGAINTGLSNVEPSTYRMRLTMRTDQDHFCLYDARITLSGPAYYIVRMGADFDDSTLRQGVGFGYSSGNVSSATLRVWGRRKPV